MLSDCPLSNAERRVEMVTILEKEIGTILDNYYKNAPFKVEQEQHYRDHEFTSELRENLSTVKTSFLKSAGKVLVLFLAGGVSWKYLYKYFSTGW